MISAKIIQSKNKVPGFKRKIPAINNIIDSVIEKSGYCKDDIKYSTFILESSDNIFNSEVSYNILFIVFEVKEHVKVLLSLGDDINKICGKLIIETRNTPYVLFKENFFIMYK